MAELLEVDARLLDSTESEQNYEEIAKGKVKQIQGALQAGGLTASELTNLYILGDDYGASFESITFCYDSTLNADELFNVVYDEQDHIKIIRTNRQELDGGCAPGYFSHRIIDSLRTHYGLADKKAAFEKLSAEIGILSISQGKCNNSDLSRATF